MAADERAELVIGVDLGGTKIEAVLARRGPRERPSVEVLERRRTPTERERGYDAILAELVELVRGVAALGGMDVATAPIGIGMPGGITRRGGLVKNSNTVCLNGRPFHADFERALGRPVVFDNDANCFTLAEATLGAAAAHREGVVFGVIMGTGVGGGISARGEIWEGAQGIAGEWGHHRPYRDDASLADPVCYCGRRGCMELYASGPAVEADYARRSGARLPLPEIARRRAEDPHAEAAVGALLSVFGRGLANVIDILDPSAIVLGGGVSNLDCLYDEGRARVADFVFNDELTTPILRNALGGSAGVFGAALIAR